MLRTNRDDVYISPPIVVELFNSTRKEVGDRILSDAKYKVLREGWIAAMFTSALSVHQGKIWRIRPNKEDVAPDYYAFSREPIPGEKYMQATNSSLEVFEWGRHSRDTLLEATQKKVTPIKAREMSVIGYAARSNQELAFREIFKKLAEEQPEVLEVWILARIKRTKTYTVSQVYPHLFSIPVPNSLPDEFWDRPFVSKRRSLKDTPAGMLSLNDQMEFTEIEK